MSHYYDLVKTRYLKKKVLTRHALLKATQGHYTSILMRHSANSYAFKKIVVELKRILSQTDYYKMLLILDTYRFNSKEFVELWDGKLNLDSYINFVNNLSPLKIKKIKENGNNTTFFTEIDIEEHQKKIQRLES